MSVFHLYNRVPIVPDAGAAPVHVGFVLFLSYLLFPVAKRYRPHASVVGLGGRSHRRGDRYILHWRRRHLGPQHFAGQLGHRLRIRVDPPHPEGMRRAPAG